MGILTKLTTMFARPTAPGDAGAQSNGAIASDRQRAVHPREPVAIDLTDESGDESTDSADSPVSSEQVGLEDRRGVIVAPRNRQELLAELQKNYAEVLELVRKVSSHLDDQESRANRLMEIAERLPQAMETLPHLQQQNAEMLSAVHRLVELNVSQDERSQDSIEQLATIRDRLEDSQQSQQQLVATMAEFRGSIGDVSRASDRVGQALEGINEQGAQRDREFARLIESNRKWTTALLVASGVVAAAAAASIIVAIVG